MRFKKKFLFVFGVLIILALIYIFFIAPKTGTNIIPENNIVQSSPQITPQPSPKVFQISKVPSSNSIIINDEVYYFEKNTGKLVKSDLKGLNQSALQNSESILKDVVKIIHSGNKNFIAVSYNAEEDLVRKYSLNLSNLLVDKPLNDKIRYLDFSPDGQQIVYQYYDEATGLDNISIANPNGSNYKNIFFLRLRDIIPFWIQKDLIAILTKPSGYAKGYLYTINTQGKNFTKIIGDVYGLTVNFSPNGQKFLYSQTDANGKNLTLNLATLDGKIKKVINIKTLPEKCVWSQNNLTIYCAVFKQLDSSRVMPDDFYKDYQIFDDFYKINTETGEMEQIQPTETSKYLFNAKDLMLDSMENYLIFLNKNDLNLYSIKL